MHPFCGLSGVRAYKVEGLRSGVEDLGGACTLRAIFWRRSLRVHPESSKLNECHALPFPDKLQRIDKSALWNSRILGPRVGPSSLFWV